MVAETVTTATNDESLLERIRTLGPREAAELLSNQTDVQIGDLLQALTPAVAQDILAEFDEERRQKILAAQPRPVERLWTLNQSFEEGSVGRMMEPPTAVFRPDQTIAEATAIVRELVKKTLVTYGFVIDSSQKLIGVITMRDLLLTSPDRKLGEVMIQKPFFLNAATDLMAAMKEVVHLHFPVYPVCHETGKLIGQVRGQAMFQEQAIEISAQAGRMVGVDKEERLSTPWQRSLKFRHPWLQLNLLTAFAAAAVVGFFQETIDKVVVLAVFLPVLAGQSGNTGCQALAVALRGLTLGELRPGKERALVLKEGLLGLLNGALVGVSAAIGMYIVASMQKHPAALVLALVVFVAMTGSCIVSGISGAVIPLTLRRLGADPATASSIFLTTATDVASMGIFLALATALVTK